MTSPNNGCEGDYGSRCLTVIDMDCQRSSISSIGNAGRLRVIVELITAQINRSFMLFTHKYFLFDIIFDQVTVIIDNAIQ